MFIRKYALPALSVVGMLAATYTVMTSNAHLAAAPPIADPAASPYRTQIAGAGLIESASENIAVSAPLSGLVVEIPIARGQKVERGAILFRLDNRDRLALAAVRRAEADAARAEVAHLEALPRPEDLPPARANVRAAQTALDDARARLALAEGVTDKRAVSAEELTRRRFAVEGAQAELESVAATLAKLEAGAWKPEVDVAKARLATSLAALAQVEVDLERLVVRAPIAGSVLQINLRPGEFADAGSRSPAILLGDLSVLHVRVDVDESDAWRLRRGAVGQGFVRGNPQLSTPLEFVRVDPYVVPKRSLTGDPVERVDTRVLQVIYRFPADALPVYPGQQMDVFLDAALSSAGAGDAGNGR
jgi:HlyD family secretion protein